MINKRILIVATYPIENPQHGGQKRLHAIYDEYRSAFKEVKFCAVYYKGFYSYHGSDDIAVGPSTQQAIQNSPFTGDIACGEAIYEDSKVRKQFTKLISSLNPEIIHIEQPYSYIGLKPLLKQLDMHPKIVFGSQNIEAPMKREILSGLGVPADKIQKAEALIEEVEADLSRDSELVIACTKSDMAAHKAMGARKVVLAQNGIALATTTPKAKKNWADKFNKQGIKNKALFVGSAHPPNWTGFFDMVGKGLGFIPTNTKIVIAGSICDYFEQSIKEDSLSIEDATFWLRAMSAGRLSEDNLGALIELADVIILPITEGGGSNLKTAEAILADKKVVATTHALRSYEWFKDFPNVWIADTKDKFQESILKAINAPYIKRNNEQKKMAEQVEWQYRLADMVKNVGLL